MSILVTIAYPGSRVSDIYIGDTKVQLPNSDLIKANIHGITIKPRGDDSERNHFCANQ